MKSNPHTLPTKKNMKVTIIHTWPSAYASSQQRQQVPRQGHGPTGEDASSAHSTAVQLRTSGKTLLEPPDSQY